MACKVFRDVKFGSHAQSMGLNPVLWQTNNNGRITTMSPYLPTMVKVEKETFISYGFHSDTASHPESSSLNSDVTASSTLSPRASQACEV